jgi:transposase-like protein
MPKPKQRSSDATEKQLQKAIRAVQSGLEGGVASAVEIYGVSRTTLYYRLSGKRESRQKAHESQQRLITAEEKAVVRWCFEMDDRGFPPRLDIVKDMVLFIERK